MKHPTFHRRKGIPMRFVFIFLFGGEQAFAYHALALAPRCSHPHAHRRCQSHRPSPSIGDGWSQNSQGRPRLRQPTSHGCSYSSLSGRKSFALSASRNDNNELQRPATADQAAGLVRDAEFEAQMRREFDAIGGGADGIARADIRQRLAFLPMSVVEPLFALADVNDDGTIDFEEYKAARREASRSPQLRLYDLLNLPLVEILNITAILLCSFLVAVGTLESLPRIPVPTAELQHVAQDVLHLTLTRDGRSIEAIILINATLVLFNKIFAFDFFLRWFAFGNFKPKYLNKPLVLLDIVVVLIPLGVQQFFPFLSVFNSPGLQNLLLVRILRFQRVLTDMNTFSRFELALGLPAQAVRPYQLQLARVLLSVFTLLSVSSGLIYTTEHIDNPEIPDYFAALYFGLTTLTTVGFGDIAPITPGGRLVVCCSILAGVAVIPAQAASLLDAILESQNETAATQALRETEAGTMAPPVPRPIGDLPAAATQVAIVGAVDGEDSVPVQEEALAATVGKHCPDCEQTEHRGDACFCWSCGSKILPKK